MIGLHRRIGWLFLLLASPALVAEENAANADGPRRLTLEDHRAVKSPESLALSPDGRQVAFVLDDRVWVASTAGGAARAVTSDATRAWEPRWTRDGGALHFLSDRGGSSQLWRLPVASFGEAFQVTRLAQGVDSIDLSPDETRLLLRFTDTALAEPPKEGAKEGEEKKEPWVITRLEFKEDAGEGYIAGDRAEHLHVLELASGRLAQITSGAYSESDAAWSPDGRQVVFVSNREAEPDASYKTDLWRVSADNNDRGASLERLTNDERVKSDPAWSPDGRFIAFLQAEDGVYGLPQVAIIPVGGGQARVLTAALDRWVSSFRYSADGRWIYFSYDELGGSRVGRVSPDDARIETVLGDDVYVGEFDVGRNGLLVARIEEGNRPPEIHAITGTRQTRLTRINDGFLASVALGTKESVTFRSADGTEVQAFVTKPPGFEPGRRYPTVLNIHGGPVGQFGWGYDFRPQYLAANGYVVVEPNPRGSTGRGQEFVRAIYRTWGITDYDDLIAAVDHAVAAGYADPDRLAVTGYSYGGYMTNVAITRTDRFKAAASGAGHAYIVANYGHDIYQKWYNWELGPPWENREKYDRLSPLLQAGRVTTPTLFLGGREDWNVPLLNAELFYQSLRSRGIDTQLVVYPDTHHGGWSPEFERDYINRVREWFDKYLK